MNSWATATSVLTSNNGLFPWWLRNGWTVAGCWDRLVCGSLVQMLCFAFCRDNILVLDVFFEALNYETIEQKKAYEVAGLLGRFYSLLILFSKLSFSISHSHTTSVLCWFMGNAPPLTRGSRIGLVHSKMPDWMVNKRTDDAIIVCDNKMSALWNVVHFAASKLNLTVFVSRYKINKWKEQQLAAPQALTEHKGVLVLLVFVLECVAVTCFNGDQLIETRALHLPGVRQMQSPWNCQHLQIKIAKCDSWDLKSRWLQSLCVVSKKK